MVDYIKELGRMILGTARCDTFRKREGRLKVVENLMMKARINNLVVMGGDGSLMGRNICI